MCHSNQEWTLTTKLVMLMMPYGVFIQVNIKLKHLIKEHLNTMSNSSQLIKADYFINGEYNGYLIICRFKIYVEVSSQ